MVLEHDACKQTTRVGERSDDGGLESGGNGADRPLLLTVLGQGVNVGGDAVRIAKAKVVPASVVSQNLVVGFRVSLARPSLWVNAGPRMRISEQPVLCSQTDTDNWHQGDVERQIERQSISQQHTSQWLPTAN